MVNITCWEEDNDYYTRDWYFGDEEDIYYITALVMCEKGRICIDGAERHDREGNPIEIAFCVRETSLLNFVLLASEKNRTSGLSSQLSKQSSLNYSGSPSEASRESSLNYYESNETSSKGSIKLDSGS